MILRLVGAAVGLAAVWIAGSARAQTTNEDAPVDPNAAPAEAPVASSPPAAATVAPASTATHGHEVSVSDDTAWRERYSAARNELLAGHFADAATRFHELARSAKDPVDRALAREQGSLAEYWASRQLVLSSAGAASKSDEGRAAGRRSTDEIAILYSNAVLFGLGSGGWLAAQTEPESPGGAILPALGFAGAAVGAVALVDGAEPLGYGVPQSIVSGMYIGLEEGISWAIWNQARANYYDQWEVSTVASVIWGMTALGAAAGGVVGSLKGTTPGRASFVGSAALWSGLVAGLGAGALTANEGAQDDHAMLAAAIGVSAGAIGGVLAAGPTSPSIARVRFLDLGGMGGSILIGGLYLAVADQDPESRALMTATALGAVGGLGVAWFATAKMAEDRPDRADQDASWLAGIQPMLTPTTGGGWLGLRGTL